MPVSHPRIWSLAAPCKTGIPTNKNPPCLLEKQGGYTLPIHSVRPYRLDISLVALRLWSGIGTGDQAQHGKDTHHGRAAVAEERQGQADNGHNANAHTHVNHQLEHQSGSSAVGNEPPHIVRAPGAHIDAPGNNQQLHDNDGAAAHKAQLLADGGENIVRMLGKQVAALGTVAVEQALARQAAAGQGLEVDLTVVPGAGALGIEGRINQDHNSLLLVGTQQRPGNGNHHADPGKGQQKPPQAHASGKGHTNEGEHKDQGHAGVAGQNHVQAHNEAQVEHHVHDRGNAGYVVLVGGHYRCHNQNKGNLADFGRLNIKGQNLEVQPASVTCVVIGSEGDQQQKHEHVKGHQHRPVLGDIVHIDGGDQGVGHDADHNCRQLNEDIFGIAAKLFRIGGAGNDNTARTGGNHTQNQQNPISLFGEILQFFQILVQEISSFQEFRFIIAFPLRDVNRRNVNR